MRSGVMWRLVLFVLAAGNDLARASGATRGLPTDDKVDIVFKSSKLLLGSCPIRSIMQVRLQSLKTKSGTIFRRKAIADGLFACLADSGSQPLAAGNIMECSEKAVGAGLEMFRWDGGNCTGYTNGIPVTVARCAGAGSVVLYSVDGKAKSPVVRNITFSFSSSNTINAAWDVTPKSCFSAYRVSFNNIDAIVSATLAPVSFGTASPCAEYPLTVTPLDANSVVTGAAATVKVVMPKACELFLNLTHGVTAVKAEWRVEYTCNPNMQPTTVPIVSYSVTLGTQKKTTNNSTFEFTFGSNIGRCSDTASKLSATLNKVTCTALDGDGAELGNVTATLTDNTMPGRRYYSPSNCMFYQKLDETPGGVGLNPFELQDFCQDTMFSTVYSSGICFLTALIEELAMWENLNQTVSATPFFVGLMRRASGKWVGQAGWEVAPGNPNWDTGEPSGAGNCAELRANRKLAAVSCIATNRPTVCYDCIV